VLYFGDAKGVDTISMDSALEARGTAVAVPVNSLERMVKKHRDALSRGDLCLVTPYSHNAGFSVGAAMGRNRLIYCLADYAIVVASDTESGGTWVGVTETLKNSWFLFLCWSMMLCLKATNCFWKKAHYLSRIFSRNRPSNCQSG
jgi:predicted Rossmann fold nucleotide-binding protein DprA/Smf involved in DNA uptake